MTARTPHRRRLRLRLPVDRRGAALAGCRRRVAREQILPVIEQDFEAAHFRSELVPVLAEAGFLGMHIQGYGCAGASAVEYGLVCHELEAADSGWRTFVSVQGSLAMSAIAKHGSEEQKQEWLPRMARGEADRLLRPDRAAGRQRPGGHDHDGPPRRDGDGADWVIDGAKRWIGLASVAQVAGHPGRRPTTASAASWCRRTRPGSRRPRSTGKLSMRASIQCDIALDGVRVPADAMLPGARGLSGPFACLNEARYGIVWGAMGAARSCLEAAIGRATSREVFGRPIGANQLIQAKLADMAVEYEKGMLLALHLGRLKDRGVLTPAQISVGKLNSVREALDIAREARAILGGDGVTNEFPVMRHLANLESVRTYEGTDEIHQLVIGRALTGLNAF